MAVLGIIGGIAPPPTIHYYRAVVEIYRARSGGRAPRVLINSLDGDEVFSLLSTADGEGLAAVLLDRHPAAVQCGTWHCLRLSLFMSRTRAWPGVSPLPLIGIVDATVGASAGHHRLGIFATSFTVRSDMRRYLGLDIHTKSRLTKITNQNLIDKEVTITAITA